MTFQELILNLQSYWADRGCVILQPLDMAVGAGTFHPATFLRAIGPEPWHTAYVQPSRRPTDGRYGENPNRLQHYYQFQVLLKPSPREIQQLYLESLEMLGLDSRIHDIRFVEDNWESPTLGAWGLGWEVWLNGMEITQFTYFQQVGGLDCRPVSGEITYGLERIAMYLQDVENVYDLIWAESPTGPVTYGDVYHQNEVEQSQYNFEHADTAFLLQRFSHCESACAALIEKQLPLPAYEQVLEASHCFNLLDARKAISVTERQAFILRVRTLAKSVAESYYQKREALGFPMLAVAEAPEADGADESDLSAEAADEEVSDSAPQLVAPEELIDTAPDRDDTDASIDLAVAPQDPHDDQDGHEPELASLGHTDEESAADDLPTDELIDPTDYLPDTAHRQTTSEIADADDDADPTNYPHSEEGHRHE